MHVAVLAPSLSRKLGGVFEVEKALAHAVGKHPGVQVSAYGLDDAEIERDRAGWSPIPVHLSQHVGPAAFGYSPDLQRALDASNADVVHLHSLWMHTSVVARTWSRKARRPYITSIHGMLEPWALANSALKKRVALAAFERSALRGAACLHVNTLAELRSVRDFGLTGPVCVLPNGIDLPSLQIAATPAPDSPLPRIRQAGGKIMLYLGRIHPKKNLSAMLDAFDQAARDDPDWHLAIAGWGVESYNEALMKQAATLGVATRVHFLGPVFGPEKAAALQAADAFVLASHSEGFPMAVLEAFAYATPVLMTMMCNMPEGFAAQAALEVGTDVPSIAHGMRRIIDMGQDARAAMGAQGRALVERDYQWDDIGGKLVEVYRWMAGDAARPACIM